MIEIALFFVLTGAVGAYITSVGCRRAYARHRPPSWRYAWFATLVTVVVTVLLFCQGDLFRPSRWDTGKVSIWFSAAVISVATALPAMLGSVVVLEVFWRRSKNEQIDS